MEETESISAMTLHHVAARAASRRTILLSGFEPFAGEDVNPSWELARAWMAR
jgi:hypothetical protein